MCAPNSRGGCGRQGRSIKLHRRPMHVVHFCFVQSARAHYIAMMRFQLEYTSSFQMISSFQILNYSAYYFPGRNHILATISPKIAPHTSPSTACAFISGPSLISLNSSAEMSNDCVSKFSSLTCLSCESREVLPIWCLDTMDQCMILTYDFISEIVSTWCN